MWNVAAANLAARCSQPLSRFSSDASVPKNEFSNEIAAAGQRTSEHKRGGARVCRQSIFKRGETGSRQESASNQEARVQFRFCRNGAPGPPRFARNRPTERLVTVKGLQTRSFNCRHARNPNFKNLAVLEALLKKRAGLHMDSEILGLLVFASAAIAAATVTYQRRMDVLYGPYVRGRPGGLSMKRFWRPSSSAIDRLSELEGPKTMSLSPIGPY